MILTQSSRTPSMTGRLTWYLITILLTQFLTIYLSMLGYLSFPLEKMILGTDSVTIVRNSIRGNAYLIRDQLQAHPGNDQQILSRLQPQFAVPLHIIPVNSPLPATVQEQFQYDDVAFDEDGCILYARLNADRLLRYGPIIDPAADRALTFVVIGICAVVSSIVLFGLLYAALSFILRDALAIRSTAEKLAQGDLQARAPAVQSWLFKPLAQVLNHMAIQIEHQVRDSKIISHAMAHELRTPLTRLRFALGILDESAGKAEYARHRKGIEQDIEELESLINVSLGLFRLQQQEVVLNRLPAYLPQWGHELCAALEPFKPAHFDVICDIEDCTVSFDAKLVSLAVNNLLLNAFKYAASRVELSIRRQAHGIQIQVDDDGPGIPEAQREQIFIPFARLDTSRTRTTGGHGLGLPYVKLIAGHHHGNVQITTSPLGGCRFTLNLDVDRANSD